MYLSVSIPLSPTLLLLSDDSNLMLSIQQRKVAMAALTAAKKSILKGWFEHNLSLSQLWCVYFLNILILERAAARFHKSKAATLRFWTSASNHVTPL